MRSGESGYSEPYRLYNLDVFEYVTDSPFGLYGAVPLLWAHAAGEGEGGSGTGRNAALFWPNPSEMYVDVLRGQTAPPLRATRAGETAAPGAGGGASVRSVQSHWVAESGALDVFVLLGPSARAVSAQYAALTGPSALPALFSLGYHQCRWNYNDQQDFEGIDAKFEELDFP